MNARNISSKQLRLPMSQFQSPVRINGRPSLRHFLIDSVTRLRLCQSIASRLLSSYCSQTPNTTNSQLGPPLFVLSVSLEICSLRCPWLTIAKTGATNHNSPPNGLPSGLSAREKLLENTTL